MFGTIINAIAVVIGSFLGLILRSKLPKRITNTAFHGVGLFTIILGIIMAIKTSNFLIMIFSIVIGSLVGEIIDIDKWINIFGEWLKKNFKGKNERFSEGFITAFLLYCMGSMTILGAIEEGLGGIPNLLVAKSVLDGFSSIILAATMGIGVLFSFIPLLLFQGGLTLLASNMQNILTGSIINELSAVGGILLLGLGITILDIKKIKILNMLPSLIIVVILTYFFL
ncbi:MAG: DUF554 domain-containing protein [Thermoplasmatales archaeon]|nr:DUF554 domain-containing protein [Thermoplasmatales archaeon]